MIGLVDTSRGPMVEGIPPREASDRLTIFQVKFDELWRKFEVNFEFLLFYLNNFKFGKFFLMLLFCL
jgi:hypothetical protein